MAKPEPGYHIAKITRGELGEASKIAEETAEFMDAHAQGVRIMELVELSDLLGAVEAYMLKYHVGYNLTDLIRMKNVTKRAFENGHRVSR